MAEENYNIIEVTEGLYRIPVRLPDSPLKLLNSYYIKGIDEDYLIDTGFNRPLCEQDLSEGLAKIGADRSRISILNTHLHADHTGLNHVFLAEGHSIYMSSEDIDFQIQWFKGIKNKRFDRDKLEGASEEYCNRAGLSNPSNIWKSKDVTAFHVPIMNGQIIHAKHFDIEVVLVPGHTQGNLMFWIESLGIMLTGDHVLFDITPNITAWPGKDDMLGWYLKSLEKSKKYPVKQALPGHRNPGNYHERIDSIIEHHKIRLNEVENIIGNSEKPLNVFEITAKMQWRVHLNPDGSMPLAQLYFAAGECESHVDRLLAENRIVRIEPHDDITYRTYKLV